MQWFAREDWRITSALDGSIDRSGATKSLVRGQVGRIAAAARSTFEADVTASAERFDDFANDTAKRANRWVGGTLAVGAALLGALDCATLIGPPRDILARAAVYAAIGSTAGVGALLIRASPWAGRNARVVYAIYLVAMTAVVGIGLRTVGDGLSPLLAVSYLLPMLSALLFVNPLSRAALLASMAAVLLTFVLAPASAFSDYQIAAGPVLSFMAIVVASLAGGHMVYRNARKMMSAPSQKIAELDMLAEINSDLELEIAIRNTIEDRLREIAARDPLTGLYSRWHVMEMLEMKFVEATRYGKKLCVCLCDIDGLKGINDTYGHLVGDRAIAVFGEILTRELRTENVAGRYGGDEFVILFPHVTKEEVVVSMQRITERFARSEVQPFLGAPPIATSASFGVAEFSSEIRSSRDLVGRADAALYQAKNAGIRSRAGIELSYT